MTLQTPRPTLVTPDWVEAHRAGPGVRLIEVDADPAAYWRGHIPEALAWSPHTQLSDPTRREILSRTQWEELLGQSGITPETTVVLYGDAGNTAAAWALWQLHIHGHAEVRLLDGGRERWLAEGRPSALEEPVHPSTVYFLRGEGDRSARALLAEVRARVADRAAILLDVRPAAAFAAGHLPGAHPLPAERLLDSSGALLPPEELAARCAAAGVDGSRPVLVYSHRGHRSSLVWLALRRVLGYPAVNYDGSWLEWGSLVGAPVERGGGAEG